MEQKQIKPYLERALEILMKSVKEHNEHNDVKSTENINHLIGYLEGGIEICELENKQ